MKQSKCTHKQKQGFSLVELLAVMSIIAILMGIVLGVSGSIQATAAKAKAKAELADLQNEIEIYKTDKGAYPLDLEAFYTWYTTEKYAGTIYTLTNLDSNKLPIDPWGGKYFYDFDATKNQFIYLIGSFGPDGEKGLSSDNNDDFGDGDDITSRNGAL